MMHFDKKGSALIVALGVTMVILIVTLYLIERIVPVSRNVKGIENGNIAYYQAQSAVEDALYQLDPKNPFAGITPVNTLGTGLKGYINSGTSVGPTVPLVGQGNSEYSADWNRLGLGQPVQLKLPNAVMDWTNSVFVYIRTPKINPSAYTLLSAKPYVSWILSGNNKTLYANTQLTEVTINDITQNPGDSSRAWKLGGAMGTDLDNATTSFQTFFNTNCVAGPSVCTLKLGVINALDANVPYLEYQINFGGVNVPQQYASITAEGYSSGFKQTITKRVQQLTTNEALDFTIFQ